VEKSLNLLKRQPWHVLLLPLFFVLHGVKENFDFILFGDYLPLILLYGLSSIITYFILYLIYRKPVKAGLISFLLFSVFFFYGSIQDFLKDHLPALNRYSILIPAFFIAIVIIAILLKRSVKGFTKITFFLNCLLIIYLVADGIIILVDQCILKSKSAVYMGNVVGLILTHQA
jgi:hypothetical protein